MIRFFKWLRNLFAPLPVQPPAPAPLPDLPDWLDGPQLHKDKTVLGRQAEILMQDPLLQHVFEVIRKRYRLTWEKAARNDIEGQRNCHLAINALHDVEQHLLSYLNNARLLAAESE